MYRDGFQGLNTYLLLLIPAGMILYKKEHYADPSYTIYIFT